MMLALDIYFALEGRTPSPSHSEIQELSEILRRIPKFAGEHRTENYRSPGSVVMKLMNFRSLDPAYDGDGLKKAGKKDKELWEEFASNRERLRQTVQVIRESIEDGVMISIPIELGISEAPEGSIVTRIHITRERNKKLVNEKKKMELKTKGRLACEACGFEFQTVYGSRGKDYIECHHTKPVRHLKSGDTTRMSDLALVCANCHRMIHAKQPWLTMKELKKLIR